MSLYTKSELLWRAAPLHLCFIRRVGPTTDSTTYGPVVGPDDSIVHEPQTIFFVDASSGESRQHFAKGSLSPAFLGTTFVAVVPCDASPRDMLRGFAAALDAIWNGERVAFVMTATGQSDHWEQEVYYMTEKRAVIWTPTEVSNERPESPRWFRDAFSREVASNG